MTEKTLPGHGTKEQKGGRGGLRYSARSNTTRETEAKTMNDTIPVIDKKFWYKNDL